MTQGAYLRLDHETLRMEVEGKTTFQIPVHHLQGIALFGNVLASPFLLHRCAEDGRMVVFFDQNGRFKGRLVGSTGGNVLLRLAQHEARMKPDKVLRIARNIVAGKIQNTRQLVLRAAREAESAYEATTLSSTASVLADALTSLEKATGLEEVRGIEGSASKAYFVTFELMVKTQRELFSFSGRSRRPPLDRLNALLSFLYALLVSDCVSALEGVGLDPQIGFLHAVRPGRPALGLDLMEEFRSAISERLTLTLVNRRQLKASDFEERPGGAVFLNDSGRKTVLIAYQKRKQDLVRHPVLGRQVPLGLVPHLQARLLARHLRGDMEVYLPFLIR